MVEPALLWYSPSGVELRAHPCSVLRAASVERFTTVFLVTWTALPDLPMPLGYHAGLRAYPTIDSMLIYCSWILNLEVGSWNSELQEH